VFLDIEQIVEGTPHPQERFGRDGGIRQPRERIRSLAHPLRRRPAHPRADP
jgi:hypothetical protein